MERIDDSGQIRSAPERGGRAPTRDRSGTRDAVSVVDTTELRWFATGPLPPEVESWFTDAGTVGVVEARSDTYRMDGLGDRGVKRRSRKTLELKVRRSVGERLVLEAGLAGRLEMWRRWSPADGLVDDGGDPAWVDVRKNVVKRRFTVTGDETVFTPGAPTGAGCDAEVTTVDLDDTEAWTFALAAFGPTTSHRDAIVASWRALVADGSVPRGFADLAGHSAGYAAWLAGVGAPDRPATARGPRGR